MRIAQCGLTAKNGGARAASQISSMCGLPGTTCKKMTQPQRDRHIHILIPYLFRLEIIHIVFPKPFWSSHMASSTFEVVPALESDMGDIGYIFTVSFLDDHILGHANSKVAPDLIRAVDLEFISELWRMREAFNAKFSRLMIWVRGQSPKFLFWLPISFLFFLFSRSFYMFQISVQLLYERPCSSFNYICTYMKIH